MTTDISNEQEKLFINHFIEALKKDINSSQHGSEINSQVLFAACYLLEHPEECPHLGLEQIIHGVINMAVVLQSSKYGIITPERVGKELFNQYIEQSDLWFSGYNNALDTVRKAGEYWKIAIPVITRAAQGPLLVMSACVPNTLAVYFEYMKNFDNNIVPPKISTATSNINLNRNDELSFEMLPQKKLVRTERLVLGRICEDLSQKIDSLKDTPDISETTLSAATTLGRELSQAVKTYLGNKQDTGVIEHEAKKIFVEQCAESINKAKLLLNKELGWGDYLTNILKSISNAVLGASNFVAETIKIGTPFNFFTIKKAPFVDMVDDAQEKLKNNGHSG